MVLCGDNGEEGDGKQVEVSRRLVGQRATHPATHCVACVHCDQFADPPAGAAVGERLTLEGYEGEPDAQVNPGAKKNPWSRICEVRAALL